jgi:hypothetical protein
MQKIKVTVTLNVEGFEAVRQSFNHDVEGEATALGIKFYLEENISALKADLLYGEHMSAMPAVDWLLPESSQRSYRLEDAMKMETDKLKCELWRFLGNTALAARTSLAKAKALQEVQKTIRNKNDRLEFVLQMEKLDRLHLAVNEIAKLRDLHKRVFAIGLDRARFPITLPSGQQRPARSLKEIMQHAGTFEEVAELDAEHVAALADVAEKLEKHATETTAHFLTYKSKLEHDAPQIVDDAKFYPNLEVDEWKPIMKGGKVVGQRRDFFLRRTKPDWSFDDLFAMVVRAFEHYLGTLKQLRALKRFGPNEERSHKSASASHSF